MQLDGEQRRRALSGEFGTDVQRLELRRIAAESAPSSEFLSRRQRNRVIVLAAVLAATIVALSALKYLVRPA